MEKRKDPDYIPNDPMEIEHVDEFLKLMAVLTGDNRYVDIVKLDGKEIVNMCDVATRLENLGIQKGLAAYQQHLREYKGKRPQRHRVRVSGRRPSAMRMSSSASRWLRWIISRRTAV